MRPSCRGSGSTGPGPARHGALSTHTVPFVAQTLKAWESESQNVPTQPSRDLDSVRQSSLSRRSHFPSHRYQRPIPKRSTQKWKKLRSLYFIIGEDSEITEYKYFNLHANWVSFDFHVSYSSCWGYSLINTFKSTSGHDKLSVNFFFAKLMTQCTKSSCLTYIYCFSGIYILSFLLLFHGCATFG